MKPLYWTIISGRTCVHLSRPHPLAPRSAPSSDRVLKHVCRVDGCRLWAEHHSPARAKSEAGARILAVPGTGWVMALWLSEMALWLTRAMSAPPSVRKAACPSLSATRILSSSPDPVPWTLGGRGLGPRIHPQRVLPLADVSIYGGCLRTGCLGVRSPSPEARAGLLLGRAVGISTETLCAAAS